MDSQKTENWKLLSLFVNETRVQIIKILLKVGGLSLSEIARELEKYGFRMRLPAVVACMYATSEIYWNPV